MHDRLPDCVCEETIQLLQRTCCAASSSLGLSSGTNLLSQKFYGAHPADDIAQSHTANSRHLYKAMNAFLRCQDNHLASW